MGDDQFTNVRPINNAASQNEFSNIRPLKPPASGSPIPNTSSMRANTDPSGIMSALKDPFKALDISKGIENYTEQGRKEHPVLSRVGDVTRGAKELLFGGKEAGKPMGTESGVLNNPVTQAMSLAPDAAALGAKVEGKLASKSVDPLAKINKVIGVKPSDVRVGQTPASLGEFASNPARGLQKYGFTDKQLAKMNPLERLKSVTEARNKVGEQLDSVLQAASQPAEKAGLSIPGQAAKSAKTVNVQKVMDEAFKNAIPDKRLAKLTATRFQQILDKTGIKTPLSQLSPMEARTLQRELDEFANFAPEGTLKTFRDVATALRRGISKETGRVVPESVPLDRDYGDLANATKAVKRQAAKYASTVPQSTLRKVAPYIAGAAGLGGAEAAWRAFVPSGPSH